MINYSGDIYDSENNIYENRYYLNKSGTVKTMDYFHNKKTKRKFTFSNFSDGEVIVKPWSGVTTVTYIRAASNRVFEISLENNGYVLNGTNSYLSYYPTVSIKYVEWINLTSTPVTTGLQSFTIACPFEFDNEQFTGTYRVQYVTQLANFRSPGNFTIEVKYIHYNSSGVFLFARSYLIFYKNGIQDYVLQIHQSTAPSITALSSNKTANSSNNPDTIFLYTLNSNALKGMNIDNYSITEGLLIGDGQTFTDSTNKIHALVLNGLVPSPNYTYTIIENNTITSTNDTHSLWGVNTCYNLRKTNTGMTFLAISSDQAKTGYPVGTKLMVIVDIAGTASYSPGVTQVGFTDGQNTIKNYNQSIAF